MRFRWFSKLKLKLLHAKMLHNLSLVYKINNANGLITDLLTIFIVILQRPDACMFKKRYNRLMNG